MITSSCRIKPNYLKTLREYEVFDHESDSAYEDFTYQSPDDENLIKLKETYDLVKVAGDGDELTKIINLMKWVHNTINHNGSYQYRGELNTFGIIEHCKANNTGVNCRMLATVLNEVYLSMGYKSRFVTCLPKDTKDPDCHVINMVYSTTLSKWIYMDPSFQAYFKDENGTLLSIEEVRERMIKGEKLVLNDDIDHNGNGYSKKQYINYMNKNLFRFSCLVKSEFNSESSDKIKISYQLLPKGYSLGSEKIVERNGFKIIFISNPDFFWETPF